MQNHDLPYDRWYTTICQSTSRFCMQHSERFICVTTILNIVISYLRNEIMWILHPNTAEFQLILTINKQFTHHSNIHAANLCKYISYPWLAYWFHRTQKKNAHTIDLWIFKRPAIACTCKKNANQKQQIVGRFLLQFNMMFNSLILTRFAIQILRNLFKLTWIKSNRIISSIQMDSKKCGFRFFQ